MKLRDIACSRSGDKGDISNICVFVYDEADYLLLLEVQPSTITKIEGVTA